MAVRLSALLTIIIIIIIIIITIITYLHSVIIYVISQ
jgi:hypothetical protein